MRTSLLVLVLVVLAILAATWRGSAGDAALAPADGPTAASGALADEVARAPAEVERAEPRASLPGSERRPVAVPVADERAPVDPSAAATGVSPIVPRLELRLRDVVCAPVAHAQVRVTQEHEGIDLRTRDGSSDADGVLVLEDLIAGDHRIAAE